MLHLRGGRRRGSKRALRHSRLEDIFDDVGEVRVARRIEAELALHLSLQLWKRTARAEINIGRPNAGKHGVDDLLC